MIDISLEDSVTSAPPPAVFKLELKYNPFTVKLMDGTTVEQEIDEYPQVTTAEIVKLEIKCTTHAIQVFAQDQFLFSSTKLHVDGKIPQIGKISANKGYYANTMTMTVKYSRY